MDETKLNIYRGLVELLLETFLVIAAVVLLFWVTYNVLKSPTLVVGITEAGILTSTTYVVYNYFFKRTCGKCGSKLEKTERR